MSDTFEQDDMRRVQLSVTVKPATRQALISLAEQENSTVSRVAENLINEAMASRKKK